MTAYLVNKRMTEDRVYLPNEILIDPDMDVDILRARGFLTIVPDGYVGPGEDAPPKAEDRRPTVEESLAAGYSQEAAEALANGTYGQDPELTARIDEETDLLDQNLSAGNEDDDEPPSEATLKQIASGMLPEDLDTVLVKYEILPPDTDATREDKEAALVAYLLEHPELTTDDEPIVPTGSISGEGPDVGAAPPDDEDKK